MLSNISETFSSSKLRSHSLTLILAADVPGKYKITVFDIDNKKTAAHYCKWKE
jgi:hypothetical protein